MHTAFTAVAFLALCSASVFADRMASDIQEAIYNFEMKGNVNEAVRISKKFPDKAIRTTSAKPTSSSEKSTNCLAAKIARTTITDKACARQRRLAKRTGLPQGQPPQAKHPKRS
jgi:hypothetical protein